MAKYKWDFSKAEQAENLEVTKPEVIAKGVEPLLGHDAAAMIAEGVQEYLRQNGLDKIDRKFLAFPEAHRQADPSTAFCKSDLEDPTPWNELPQSAQQRKRVLFKGFLHNVLFGTPAERSLAAFGDATREVAPLLNVRALSSTPGEGGYLIPPGFIPYLVQDIPRMSVLFPLVREYPTGLAESGTLPTVATNAASSWGSESTEITSTDPTFSAASWTIRRHNAIATLPLELTVSTNPAIVPTVIELIQRAMAEERDRCIAYGNGSGKPTGIYQATGITDVSGITSISWANLNKILYSVDERWHNAPNARWALNQNVLNAISSLLSAVDGQPIFRPAVGDMPGTILGKRYVVSNHLPNTFIGFLDFSQYAWFNRNDMGMATDMGGEYFKKHQMAIKVWERVDGKYISPPTPAGARTKILSGVTSLVTPAT